MDVSGYNNSEGGRISYIVLQKLGGGVYLSTGICQYFSPTTRLPSHKDTGIRAVAPRKANGGVKHVLETQASQQSAKKGTGHTNFPDTDRAEIGHYAAEY